MSSRKPAARSDRRPIISSARAYRSRRTASSTFTWNGSPRASPPRDAERWGHTSAPPRRPKARMLPPWGSTLQGHVPAAVDVDRLARHVRRFGQQEMDGLRDIVRRAFAPQRRVRDDALARELVEHLFVGPQ